jgi:hypothetical protein
VLRRRSRERGDVARRGGLESVRLDRKSVQAHTMGREPDVPWRKLSPLDGPALAPPAPCAAAASSSSSERKLEPNEPRVMSGSVLPLAMTVESEYAGDCISAASDVAGGMLSAGAGAWRSRAVKRVDRRVLRCVLCSSTEALLAEAVRPGPVASSRLCATGFARCDRSKRDMRIRDVVVVGCC